MPKLFFGRILQHREARNRADVDARVAFNALGRREHRLHVAVQAALHFARRLLHVEAEFHFDVRFQELNIEVELGFDVEQTAREVQRCLNCDVETVFTAPKCIECDACIDICPVSCLTMLKDAPEEELRHATTAPALNLDQSLFASKPLPQTGRLMLKDEDLCVHCGLCA